MFLLLKVIRSTISPPEVDTSLDDGVADARVDATVAEEDVTNVATADLRDISHDLVVSDGSWRDVARWQRTKAAVNIHFLFMASIIYFDFGV